MFSRADNASGMEIEFKLWKGVCLRFWIPGKGVDKWIKGGWVNGNQMAFVRNPF